MSDLLKATLVLLGVLIVLLIAGGFPPAGVPGVYKGGAMIMTGMFTWALCLWGAWRLIQGQYAKWLISMLCAFFAVVGIIGLYRFGAEVFHLAGMGGAMWFGVVGMGCMTLIGALFGIIFSFLTWRIMTPRLWLASLHVCAALLLTGAGIDMLYSETAMLTTTLSSPGENMQKLEGKHSGFDAYLTGFETELYENYSLLQHENGRFTFVGSPIRRGDHLYWEGESWPVSLLAQPSRMHFLPGKPPRILLQQNAPVKEFRAGILFIPSEDNQDARQKNILRINEPATYADRQFYLMSYKPLGNGATEVQVMERRAPGRILVFIGLIGVIICTACWSFSPTRKPTAP